MIAKEQHKLEVLKRRQEREIQQVRPAAGDAGRRYDCCAHRSWLTSGLFNKKRRRQCSESGLSGRAYDGVLTFLVMMLPGCVLQMLQYEITRKQLLEKQQHKIDALEVGGV